MRYATLLAWAVPFTLPGLAACTAETGGGDSTPATLTVALTDAASDELSSFCVDVESIRLVRANGSSVGVLSDTTRVDLVTLTDVSQILNVVQVPVGAYTRAEVTFDFTAAEAWLVGENAPAALYDGDGVLLTGSMSLPITVAGSFAAIAGRNRILELDFDLDHSVTVDAGTNSVFVEPAIVLRVDRTDPKEMVVVGDLRRVDQAASRLEMQMQTLSGAPIRDVAVGVTGATVYQIDGVPSVGASGLAALDGLGAGTWIQVYGSVNTQTARLDAAYVEAGTGTYNGGSDIVEGHVVQRIGGAGASATLTVLGHSNNAAHTAFQFNTLFTVTTSFTGTAVTYRGTAATLDTDAVNVGQRVRVFGSLSGTTLDATAASSGVLRMQATRLLGFANAAPSGGTLDLDLVRVGLRPQTDFTWTDGGPTPPDPDAVLIDSGNLTNGLGVTAGTAVEVRGFFLPIADSGEDFVAVSVTNRDDAPSLVAIADRPSGMTLAATVGATDLTLALTGAPGFGEVAAVDRGFVGATPLPTAPDLTVQGSPGFGIYMLTFRVTHQTSVFLDYGEFLDALAVGMGGGGDVYNFGAIGDYDAGANSVAAGLIVVVLD